MLPGMVKILAILVLFTLELPTLSIERFKVTSQVVHSGSPRHGVAKDNDNKHIEWATEASVQSAVSL